MTAFKIGDRVQYTTDGPCIIYHEEFGTISGFDLRGGWLLVDFDGEGVGLEIKCSASSLRHADEYLTSYAFASGRIRSVAERFQDYAETLKDVGLPGIADKIFDLTEELAKAEGIATRAYERQSAARLRDAEANSRAVVEAALAGAALGKNEVAQ